MNGEKCSKKVGINLLSQIQILHQNNEIDSEMKTEMTALVKEGMATGNFSQLNAYINSRRFGFTFTDVILEMLRMTN